MRDIMKKHLYRFMSTFLLYGIVIFYFADYYHFHLPGIIISFFAILWIAFIEAFDENKKTPIPYLTVGIIILVLSILIIYTDLHEILKISEYYDWLWEMSANGESTNVSEGVSFLYTLLSVSLLCLLCIPLYVLTKWKLARYIFAGISCIGLIIMVITKFNIAKIPVVFLFTYLFFCLIEFSFKRQYPLEATKSEVMTTFLSPFVIALLIIFCLLKTSTNPMEFRQLKRLWSQFCVIGEQISDNFKEIFRGEIEDEFGLAFAGFSDNKTVEGDIEDSNKEELTVEEYYHNALDVYLIGNTSNYFDGISWSNTITEDNVLANYKESMLDVYEFANAIDETFSPFRSQDIMSERMIDITYKDLKTNTLFYPEKGISITSRNKLPKYDDQTSNFRLSKKAKHDMRYRCQFFDLRLGSEMLDTFLEERTKDYYQWGQIDCKKLYDEINKYVAQPNLFVCDNLGEILEYRSQKIGNEYLALPNNLSQRVIDLSEALTVDANSNYEKMKRIEAYLNTYEYTKHPKQTKKGEDIVDYFLFESKEGYCTYFATTMAIMGRCIGIPTRYVQGFIAPMAHDPGVNVVTGNNAHAWVEAYFKGVGWIPFEPTTGYSDYLYKAREKYNNEETKDKSEGSSYLEYLKKLREQGMKEEVVLEPFNPQGRITKWKTYIFTALFVLGILLLISIVSLMYVLLRIRFLRSSYYLASREERIYITLKRILFMIHTMKLNVEENETLLKQFECFNSIPELKKEMPIEVANKFMILCYGDGNLSEVDENEIFSFYRSVLMYLKDNMKPLAYLILTFKILKIHKYRT